MLTVNFWPQASKKSKKRLRASKIDLNLVLQGHKRLGTFLLTSLPSRMFPNVFEINEDKRDFQKCWQ